MLPPNSLLKKSVFRRRRGDESQISLDFEGKVRDSLRPLLLFQQAAKPCWSHLNELGTSEKNLTALFAVEGRQAEDAGSIRVHWSD